MSDQYDVLVDRLESSRVWHLTRIRELAEDLRKLAMSRGEEVVLRKVEHLIRHAVVLDENLQRAMRIAEYLRARNRRRIALEQGPLDNFLEEAESRG